MAEQKVMRSYATEQNSLTNVWPFYNDSPAKFYFNILFFKSIIECSEVIGEIIEFGIRISTPNARQNEDLLYFFLHSSHSILDF
jgi:hypothetical protein